MVALLAVNANRISKLFDVFLGFQVEIDAVKAVLNLPESWGNVPSFRGAVS